MRCIEFSGREDNALGINQHKLRPPAGPPICVSLKDGRTGEEGAHICPRQIKSAGGLTVSM